MKSFYQLVILGNKNNDSDEIIKQLGNKLSELRISKNVIKRINSNNIDNHLIKSPTICLYFGNKEKKDKDIIDRFVE